MKWLVPVLLVAVVAVVSAVVLFGRSASDGESTATLASRGQPEQGVVVQRGGSWQVTGWGNETVACVRYSSQGRMRSESCGPVPDATHPEPLTSAVLITMLWYADDGVVAGSAVDGVDRVVIRVNTNSTSAEVKPAPGTAGGFFAARVPERWFHRAIPLVAIDSYDESGNLIETFTQRP